MNTPTLKRIESIDILRGIVMVIMALDHVRDFFHVSAQTGDPLDIEHYDLPLYFTRWITHFCAPIFVFLSGTSIYLQSFRKSSKELAFFVIKRGLWLILAEWTLIAFAWTFNPYFEELPFQVIWAIGLSMVILGLLLLLKTPYKVILLLGILIVVGHNALDFVEDDADFKANFIWDIVHSGFFTPYPFLKDHYAIIVYPFLPWTGLMFLGYCFGKLFAPQVSAAYRIKWLRIAGSFILIFFAVIRFTNLYGDPFDWATYPTFVQTFLSFIKVHKYPPSLMYLSVTIGFGFIALSFLEHSSNRFTAIMKTFGRTAFFYYILHLYLIHIIAVIYYFANGNSLKEVWNIGENFPFLFVVPGQGENLGIVYLIWIGVVVCLFPICKWYDNYKTSHKEKWWLSYL